MRPAAGLLLPLLLLGCEAVPPPAAGEVPAEVAESAPAATGGAPVRAASSALAIARRLPPEAAGFRRGNLTATRTGGQEVGYRTQGRTAAGATVEVLRPSQAPDAATLDRALAELVREATQPAPARSLTAQSRLTIPDPRPERGPGAAPPGLACTETAGTYGREPVAGMVCVGAAQGALLRLRVLMPDQDPPPGDARAFAAAILAALRGA
ncbi:hypothetical protein JYK14_07260 [Siccirubricoccus sp. KC 17139]|uniref:DUF3558 domain-containing protein n=1 Tax=Siccirubricoccus soli TaxID=2899147 RepID=A0ABT1D221_9PROT|nr:hypothetical protein [Siccirubricoccus soli]MCO6415973.1 hypothetical protein [Siccirubricoccus soli]MCP2682105.1 hypothetical protein [Siccirubricoccus soli]